MSTTGEQTMGRVTEKVCVQNFMDVAKFEAGEIGWDHVRTVEIDAIVDTGTTHLSLPPAAIQQLGLLSLTSRPVRTSAGAVERRIYGGAEITVRDRTVQMSVMEEEETRPARLGHVVLGLLDFVVDPKSQRLIPNPEHGGRWMADLYFVNNRQTAATICP